MDVSLNCRAERCSTCTGCDHACHAVPPPDSFRAAREELARRREARHTDTTEETP